MILLDTNIVSETMRPRPDHTVIAWLNQLETKKISRRAESRSLIRLPRARRLIQLEDLTAEVIDANADILDDDDTRRDVHLLGVGGRTQHRSALPIALLRRRKIGSFPINRSCSHRRSSCCSSRGLLEPPRNVFFPDCARVFAGTPTDDLRLYR